MRASFLLLMLIMAFLAGPAVRVRAASKSPTPPSRAPSAAPSLSKPSAAPASRSPTKSPVSRSPTKSPLRSHPSRSPTPQPSSFPTVYPSWSPTTPTTSYPSQSPSSMPSFSPTSPSKSPVTLRPTSSPVSSSPTAAPSLSPTPPTTWAPSLSPVSSFPSRSPTLPTRSPSNAPVSMKPSFSPATRKPSYAPSLTPTSKKPSLSPTRSPSRSPSARPTHYPSLSPTLSPTIGLHPDDQAAWNGIRLALKSDFWWDCGDSSDACIACYAQDSSHYIKCALFPVLGSNGSAHYELHITEIVLPSIGAWGVAPITYFNSLKHLLFLDFDTLPNTTFINQITLPEGSTCAAVTACSDPSLPCSFGGDSCPLCDATGQPIYSTTLSTPVNMHVLGALVGTVVSLFGVAMVVALLLLCKAEFERDQRRAKRRRERATIVDIGKASARAVLNTAGLTSMASSRALQSSASLKAMKRRQSLRRKSISKRNRASTGGGRYSVDVSARTPATQWTQALDYQSGATYWINNVTGAFSWTPPAGLAPPQQQSMPLLQSAQGLRPMPSSNSFRAPPPPVPNPLQVMAQPPMAPAPVMTSPVGAAGRISAPAFNSLRYNQASNHAFGALGAAPGGFGAAPGADLTGGMHAFAPQPQDMWEEIYDSATDSSYWVNAQTGQFSYKDPHLGGRR